MIVMHEGTTYSQSIKTFQKLVNVEDKDLEIKEKGMQIGIVQPVEWKGPKPDPPLLPVDPPPYPSKKNSFRAGQYSTL